MGFSLKKALKLRFDPKTAIKAKTTLLTPSKSLTLDNIFQKLDPLLDTIDPLHNQVQIWTTGQKTTAGQSPYFQKIAPQIVNMFFPGVGSAVASVSAFNEGDQKAGIQNAAGAVVGYMGNNGQMFNGYGQMIGKVVGIGSMAYGYMSASGDLKATFEDPTTKGVQVQPIYESGSYQNPFALAAHYNTPGTNEAANAAINAAAEQAAKNRALIIGAVILAGLYVAGAFGGK